jgi:hypothetical protein
VNSLAIAAVAFVIPLLGGLAGMAGRSRLPEHHLTKDSTDVVKLAVGLMATLLALVLSLLISSANSFHGEVSNEYKQALAGVGQLDQRLKSYGPEAGDARQQLRAIVVAGARLHWPTEDFGAVPPLGKPAPAALLDLERQILRLRPANDEQKYFQAQALQNVASLVQIQRLIANQERSNGLPLPVLIAVVLCSAAIFGSFGLYAEPNATVIGALGMAAAAVAGAIFLIIELNTPFSGLLQLSSTPMRDLLTTLGS